MLRRGAISTPDPQEDDALKQLALAVETPSPWLLPYLPAAQRVLQDRGARSVAAVLNAAQGDDARSVRFVEQVELPAGEAYESFIFRTGCVPTRDNLHDLFNGLVWLTYPATKRRLNALHSRQIELHGTAGPRGTLRDALTLFDENAALLQGPPAVVEALRQRDWETLFVKRRSEWASARLLVFGHALLEKLVQPRKAITAHVWRVEDLGDAAVAASLDAERLEKKDFLPLPVLGVPGWWKANENPAFYEDVEVFRRHRAQNLETSGNSDKQETVRRSGL